MKITPKLIHGHTMLLHSDDPRYYGEIIDVGPDPILEKQHLTNYQIHFEHSMELVLLEVQSQPLDFL
jgi:hypothetical protein